MILKEITNYNFLDKIETSEFIYFETVDRLDPEFRSYAFRRGYSFKFVIVHKFSPGEFWFAINTFKLKFI